jgi:hypothetical protein
MRGLFADEFGGIHVEAMGELAERSHGRRQRRPGPLLGLRRDDGLQPLRGHALDKVPPSNRIRGGVQGRGER